MRWLVASMILGVAGALVWSAHPREGGSISTGDDLPASAGEGGSAHDPPRPHNILSELEIPSEPEGVRGDLRLEGQVVDELGQGIGSALVVLAMRTERHTVTEADGSFFFSDLVARDYTLIARIDERAAGPVTIALHERSEPVILRTRSATMLEVRVVDARAGTPVAGALVDLRGVEARTALTSRDGRAQFPATIGGMYAVKASADGYGPTISMVHVVGQGAREATAVALQRGAPVTGYVMDEREAPVAGARVVPVNATMAFASSDPIRDGVVTDHMGRWSIPALAPGEYRFLAVHDTHVAEHSDVLSVTEDGAEIVHILMRGGVIVTGRVVDASGRVPPSRAFVRARYGGGVMVTRDALADIDGRFEIAGLPRREIAFMARTDRATGEARLDLGATPVAADVEIVLSADVSIRGIVYDSKGDAVPEATVLARPAIWSRDAVRHGQARATTDIEGRFELRALAVEEYALYVARPGHVARNPPMGLPLARARGGDDDVEIHLDEARAIQGRLTFGDGTSPARFAIILDGGPPLPVSTPDGRFRIRDLQPGRYRLTFTGPGFAEKILDPVVVARERDTDLGVIEALPGRQVYGRVVDVDGRPVAGAMVTVGSRLVGDGVRGSMPALHDSLGVSATRAEPDGSFVLRDVGVRELVAMAEHEGGRRSHAVTIPAGTQRTRVELALRQTGRIAGVVTRGDGKPAEGVEILAALVARPGVSFVVHTGPDGSFHLTKLAPGMYSLFAMERSEWAAQGVKRQGVRVEAGETTAVRLEIARSGVAVIVDARMDGEPVTDGQMLLESLPDGEDGDSKHAASHSLVAVLTGEQVRFAPVPPGRYRACLIPATGSGRILDAEELRSASCQILLVQRTPEVQRLRMEIRR